MPPPDPENRPEGRPERRPERRIACIALPSLAMDRWQRVMERIGEAPPDDLPVALAEEAQHGPVIVGCNRAAALAGVRVGARVVDMRALVPVLRVEYADRRGDAQLLARLVHWVRRWGPISAADGAAGLVVDTTGVAHLWGGEAQMLADMEARFALAGLRARIALAPTWGAAWALARFGPVRAICPAGASPTHLAPLPVAALRLPPDTVQLLGRLGLKTIGDLAVVPRLSLTRRFARAPLPENPVLRLDQAFGSLAEPITSPEPAPRFTATARLPEPILDPAPHLPKLCEDLCAQLEAAGHGARKLRLTVYHTDGEVSQIEAALSAHSRAPAHVQGLFRDKLDRINPGYGFDLITLEAGATEPMLERQPGLDGQADDGVHLSRLVDRLGARLGAQNVSRPLLRASHIPERAEAWQSALGPRAAPLDGPARARPTRLLDSPEEVRVLYAVPEGPPAQFIWRKQTHEVRRHAGPERIAPEWWSDAPGTRLRDYFRIEDQAGRRFWLYREGVVGDGRGGLPRWYVHGMFS